MSKSILSVKVSQGRISTDGKNKKITKEHSVIRKKKSEEEVPKEKTNRHLRPMMSSLQRQWLTTEK